MTGTLAYLVVNAVCVLLQQIDCVFVLIGIDRLLKKENRQSAQAVRTPCIEEIRTSGRAHPSVKDKKRLQEEVIACRAGKKLLIAERRGSDSIIAL